MRADRLLSIILLLQAHGKMTAKELSEHLEVSERTILRDMDALSTSGVPVFAERGSGGGWQLAEGFRTSLTGLKKEEAAAQALLLLSASPTLHDLGLEQPLEGARLKLQAALPAMYRKDIDLVRERIHIDGAGWNRSREPVPHLLRIQEAVWAQERLRIVYLRHDGTVRREIDPLGLVAKSGAWYVVALVHEPASAGEEAGVAASTAAPGGAALAAREERGGGAGRDLAEAVPVAPAADAEGAAAPSGGIRTYRVSRIEAADGTGETFARPEHFDLAAYWEQSTAQFHASLPQYTARVRLDGKLLRVLGQRRFVSVQHARPADDNDVWLADIRFDGFDAACETLLGLGPQVEVAEPEELRRELKIRAEAVAAMYAKDDPACAKS
ncbi:helix-turn-helix transcriptional regulator [Paenibacillus hamazuiensis]|uniref:helix-turn-helix transcriptional regulator n=1 Tax=Paenibacillus hamazuiensis TaxID=2936508 RepID=UPI00200C7122|nr:WYL domain-containing protein [Paenibacillus hamazuiensis]